MQHQMFDSFLTLAFSKTQDPDLTITTQLLLQQQ